MGILKKTFYAGVAAVTFSACGGGGSSAETIEAANKNPTIFVQKGDIKGQVKAVIGDDKGIVSYSINGGEISFVEDNKTLKITESSLPVSISNPGDGNTIFNFSELSRENIINLCVWDAEGAKTCADIAYIDSPLPTNVVTDGNPTGTTEPTDTNETGTTEPTDTNETGTTEPTDTNETGTTEPTDTNETGTTEPTDTNETGTTEPTDTNETGTTEPTDTNETGTTEPTDTNETGTTEPTDTNETVTTEPTDTNESTETTSNEQIAAILAELNDGKVPANGTDATLTSFVKNVEGNISEANVTISANTEYFTLPNADGRSYTVTHSWVENNGTVSSAVTTVSGGQNVDINNGGKLMVDLNTSDGDEESTLRISVYRNHLDLPPSIFGSTEFKPVTIGGDPHVQVLKLDGPLKLGKNYTPSAENNITNITELPNGDIAIEKASGDLYINNTNKVATFTPNANAQEGDTAEFQLFAYDYKTSVPLNFQIVAEDVSSAQILADFQGVNSGMDVNISSLGDNLYVTVGGAEDGFVLSNHLEEYDYGPDYSQTVEVFDVNLTNSSRTLMTTTQPGDLLAMEEGQQIVIIITTKSPTGGETVRHVYASKNYIDLEGSATISVAPGGTDTKHLQLNDAAALTPANFNEPLGEITTLANGNIQITYSQGVFEINPDSLHASFTASDNAQPGEEFRIVMRETLPGGEKGDIIGAFNIKVN